MIEVIGKPPVGRLFYLSVDGEQGEELLAWAKFNKMGDVYWNRYRTRDIWTNKTRSKSPIIGGLTVNHKKKKFDDEFYRYNFWVSSEIDYAFIKFAYG